MNPVLLAGALLGLLSVILGASSEHILRTQVDEEIFRWLMTAIRYHQVGALLVSALGLALLFLEHHPIRKPLIAASWLFIVGTVLFSFSIYVTAATGVEAFTYLTPVGGTTLMLGWAVLIKAAYSHK